MAEFLRAMQDEGGKVQGTGQRKSFSRSRSEENGSYAAESRLLSTHTAFILSTSPVYTCTAHGSFEGTTAGTILHC